MIIELIDVMEVVEDLSEEIKETIRVELIKAFSEYINKLINYLIDNDINNVKKALDIESDTQLELIESVVGMIKEYENKQEIKAEEWTILAINILQVIHINL